MLTTMRTGPVKSLSRPRATSTITDTTVTCLGAPHTKGLWTELLASTPAGVTLLVFYANQTQSAGVDSSMLLDIGVGSVGFEVVLIPDLLVGYTPTTRWLGRRYEIPIDVPAGVRIAARAQGAISSDTVRVCVDLWGGGGVDAASSGQKVSALGVNTATSRGVSVTASATANTKGSWAEVVASTPHDIARLLWAVQGNGRTVVAAADIMLDIGAGAAGSEVVLIPDLLARASASEDFEPFDPALVPVGLSIPAGSRLAARVAASTGSESYDVALHGIAA